MASHTMVCGTVITSSRIINIRITIRQAMEINDRPVIVDFTVSADAMVWPLVPAGVSNDEIQIAQGMSPEWERDI